MKSQLMRRSRKPKRAWQDTDLPTLRPAPTVRHCNRFRTNRQYQLTNRRHRNER
jgi:hypothetical protein